MPVLPHLARTNDSRGTPLRQLTVAAFLRRPTMLGLPVLVLTAFLVSFGSRLPAATPARNEAGIAEVAAGTATRAKASWWGYDPVEATSALQAAIDSGVPTLVVDKQAGPWIVDQIQLRSDQEIIFEPGVEVLAKKGAFQGTRDALFSAWDCRNITLTGPGATWRMRRDDYAQPPYVKGEWRHTLNLRGCENVTVTGLTLAESGGDGIYLGVGRKNKACRDIVIRDVTCDRNYRQGISVISAENLLIENCVLKDTAGTPPAAGIDFEPNHASERLVNCVMRNCVIEDNQGYAIHVYARPLTGESADMSVRIENCITRGTNARSVSVVTSNGGPAGPVKGRVEFVGCRFEDVGRAGVAIGSKPACGAVVRFEDCVIADSSPEPGKTPPIVFHSRMGDELDIGGVEFAGLTIRERTERPLFRFDDRAGLLIRGISGRITVERDGARQQIDLDQASVDRLLPANAFMRIPAWDLTATSWQGVRAAPPPEKLPRHQLRQQGVFWMRANAGDTVRCELRHQRLGRAAGNEMPVQVLSPAGQQIATARIPLDEQATVSFEAAESGVYRIVCLPGRHTVRMLASSHAFCLGGYGSVIHFVVTLGDFYFWVPPGVRTFAVRAQGEGEGERIGVTLFDAAGREVWDRPNLGGAEHHQVDLPQNSAGEIWRLRMTKAPEGVLEDHYVELRGIPAILALTPETVLRAVR